MHLSRALSDPDEGLLLINQRIASARSELGELAYEAFKQADFLPSAIKLLEDIPLTAEEISFLARDVSLSLLQALANKPEESLGAQPVILINVATELLSHDKQTATNRIRNRIRRIDAGVTSEVPIGLAVDCWEKVSELRLALEVLERVARTDGLHNEYMLLGPSTAEVSRLLDVSPNLDLSTLFKMLSDSGIKQLYGGWDEEIFWEASIRGFSLAIGQAIDLSDTLESNEILESVIERLLRLREFADDCISIWFPVPLISPSQISGPQLVVVLKAIALAKLLLPQTKTIRVPLSYFGNQFTRLALLAGANDIGLLALDRETKMSLDISLASSARSFREKLPFNFIY